MKKILLLLSLLACVCNSWAQEADSRIFTHPGRETFVYFPSQELGPTNTVTFFLPEKSVPLTQSYPVIVVLGLVPKQAQEVAQFQQEHRAIVVGINFEEKDYATRATQIERFLMRELLPYVDTNYLTKTGPENRILAVQRKSAARIALRVTQNPNLFGGVALFSPGDVWNDVDVPNVRTLVVGTQPELALAQETLEQYGKTYGPDFALRYNRANELWFRGIDASYLWADKAQTQVKYARADVSLNKVSLAQPQDVFLRIWVVLANNSLFHYVPSQLRMSPPYLTWNPLRGALQSVSGAVPGTVRVRNVVDKPAFAVKVRLKK